MSLTSYFGNDPGASKHGNFINYYKFHPVKDRLACFPTDCWWVPTRRRYSCLDVGCNSGELTQALWEFISSHVKLKSAEGKCDAIAENQAPDGTIECEVLGLDLDPTLILRAEEANPRKGHIHFKCCDIMNDSELEEAVRDFCSTENQDFSFGCNFDAVFLLSVTMWIHLNHGDLGLRTLLLKAAKLSRTLIVIEPQLWKCYSAAKRRCARVGADGFTIFQDIKLRSDTAIENEMDEVLTEVGFKKIAKMDTLTWNRRMIFYQKCRG